MKFILVLLIKIFRVIFTISYVLKKINKVRLLASEVVVLHVQLNLTLFVQEAQHQFSSIKDELFFQ